MSSSSTHNMAKQTERQNRNYQKSKTDPCTVVNFQNVMNFFRQSTDYFISTSLSDPKQTKKRLVTHQNDKSTQFDSSLNKENNILSYAKKLASLQKDKIHFDDDEKQIILEQGLIMCSSMIQAYQTTTQNKKSSDQKRFLTKFLRLQTKFLVEKILQIKKLKLSTLLIKINYFLTQGSSFRPTQGKQINYLKKQVKKNCDFNVSLPITNIKISFEIYFCLSLAQQSLLSLKKNRMDKDAIQNVLDQIKIFIQQILLSEGNHQNGQILIKAVCQTVGSLEFPIAYLFFASIVNIIENQFTLKYQNLNNINTLPMRYNREWFSFKNLKLIKETLSRYQKKAYSKVECKLCQQDLSSDQYKCHFCNIATDKFVKMQLVTKNIQKNNIDSIITCSYCFSNRDNQKLLRMNLEKCQSQKSHLLIRLFERIFWRQQFQIQQIKTLKLQNIIFLELIGCYKNQKQLYSIPEVKYNNQIHNQNQIAQKCLFTLFRNSFNNLSDVKSKTLRQISLKSLQLSVVNIFLIILNSQSQHLRNEAIQSISTNTFLLDFSQNLCRKDIEYLFEQIYQNPTFQLPNNPSIEQKIRYKSQLLLIQLKKRLVDNSVTIQIKAFSFFTHLIDIFESNFLMIQLFNFVSNYITEMAQNKSLKNIPLSLIKRLSLEIEKQYNLKKQHHLEDVVVAKHMITKTITMIFNCMECESNKNLQSFNIQQVRQTVKIVKKLMDKLLYLIHKQQQLSQSSVIKPQYQNLVINYLKIFEFTKQTILSFKINDNILEKLILLTETEEFQNYDQQSTNNNKTCLLKNLKLILQKVFDFNEIIQKNQLLSKSKKKLNNKKSKNLKPKNKPQQNTNDLQIGFQSNPQKIEFQFKQPNCNLNRIIKNVIKNKKQLNYLNCQILGLLIQKNILLNYQTQSNISNTPSKIKRLILSLETIKRFNQILAFLENQIKECNIELLNIYVKLFVLICIQINQQRKIQSLFTFYHNVFRYFKKQWKSRYDKQFTYTSNYDSGEDENLHSQTEQRTAKNNVFFTRALKTIALLSTQLQRFKKIHYITETYLSGLKHNGSTQNKYSIFSASTQDAINSLDTQPQRCFVQLYQQIYQILDILISNSISEQYQKILSTSLQIVSSILQIHPYLILKVIELLQIIPKRIKLNSDCLVHYFSILESINMTKDSILMSIVPKTYFAIEQYTFEINQNKTKLNFSMFQQFYKVTFDLLNQDIISIQQISHIIIYGLLTKNIKINKWTIDYMDYLNQKGNDSLLLNNFNNTIIRVSQKLRTNNPYFYEDEEIFRNIMYLTNINKEDKNKKSKLLLQKDIKQIKIRSTFIKKVSELFSSDFHWLKYTDEYYDRAIFFLLKIISHTVEMDIFELQELIFSMEKVVKQYYLSILRINDIYKKQQEDQQVMDQNIDGQDPNIHLMGQKRRQKFIVGQFMFTLISLLGQKRLKSFNRQIQTSIQNKKFTSTSINISLKSNKGPKIEQLARKQEYIQNYQSCLSFIKSLDTLVVYRQVQSYEEMKRIMLKLTKDFKVIAKKMYSIIFQNQKARQIKHHPSSMKEIKKKKIKMSKNSSQDDSECSQSDLETQYTFVSKSSDLNEISNISSNNPTKKIQTRSNSLQKSNEKVTKKSNLTENRNIVQSNSVPKNIDRTLSIIHESNNEQNLDYGNQNHQQTMTRKSKRIHQKKSKVQYTI